MKIYRKASLRPAQLGLLAGTFNPPTVAHLRLGEAALRHVDEVLFVLPRRFPHKQYTGPGFDERLELLLRATEGYPQFSVGDSEGGLFLEIAEECRAWYPPPIALWFVCGKDAAERVLNWNYEDAGTVPRMLERFGLLVADRAGRYEPPAEYAARIRRLELPAGYSHVSATEVRRRIAAGEPWEHLVPESIVDMVRRLYMPGSQHAGPSLAS